jgi:GTP pyrophosphokinase
MSPDRITPKGKAVPDSENLLQGVPALVGGTDPSSLERARVLLASKSSEDQCARECMGRGLEAAELLGKLGMDADILAVALLLPLVETRALDTAAVKKWAGDDVARLIQGARRIAVLKDLRQTATETVQANRLRQMLLTIAEDPRVVLVSLAHQLCLLRAAAGTPEQTRRALGEETLDLFAPLANRLGVWQLKQELEDLAFRYLEPDTYQRITGWLDQRHKDRELYIAQVIGRLQEELQRAGVNAEISGRPKHIYSIWSKMRRKGLDLSRVFDVLGFRILVNEVSDCYAALGVVQGLWEPILDEYDDYIAKPKPNGYQSLHSAVIGPEGTTMEVQIRTFAMHRHADLGVAAHWLYKEGLQRRIAWSRGFLESGESTRRGTDLIERFKQLAFQDRIYVLTPRGHVIDLPVGATPLDFAYAIHTEVGHRCRSAKVDGVMVSLTQRLASGQQVEILTARESRPSRDWLNPTLGYLKTASARAKVRHWFKQQDHELHVTQGRAVLERERRRLGLNEINIAELAKRFKMRRAEELLAALGRGDITTVQLGHALDTQLPSQPPGAAAQRPVKRPRPRGNLLVHGASNVLTKMAGCCRPVPGEAIGGYVTTQGQGVSIHRLDCPNLKQLAALRPHKLVEVAWGETSGQSHPVDIEVVAHDRRGLLRDLSDAFASEKINIVAVNTLSDQVSGTAHMRFTLEVDGAEQLERALKRIARLPDVYHARRKT